MILLVMVVDGERLRAMSVAVAVVILLLQMAR